MKKYKKLEAQIEQLTQRIDRLDPPKPIDENPLEIKKWYKNIECKALFYIEDFTSGGWETISYGFNIDGKWYDKSTQSFIHSSSFVPASKKEIQDALINEAKKRGLKQFDKYTFTPCDNTLYYSFGGIPLFQNGVWAEIVEETKIIDWTVAGQKVIADVEGTIVLTSGEHRDTYFEGMCIAIRSTDNESFLGEYRQWNKNAFKMYNEQVVL